MKWREEKEMITVILPESEKEMFKSIYELYPENIDEIRVDSSFDGVSLLQVFLEITLAVIPTIASILIAKNNRNLIITIKDKNGREITAPIKEALEKDELAEFLKHYIDETDN